MFSNKSFDALIALADLGSFRAAASAIGVSQPTLTRLIQKAETECGAAIFERTAKGAYPTAPGRDIIAMCRELRATITSVARDIRAIGERGGGELVIGCGPLTTRNLVSKGIQALLQKWPEAQIRVIVGARVDPLAELMNRNVDIFLGDLTHTVEYGDLEIAALAQNEVVVVGRPGHAVHKNTPRTLAEVLAHPLALPHLHKHWRNVIEAALSKDIDEQLAKRRIPQIECDDYALLADIVCNSDFLSAGARENFAEQLSIGTLREVLLKQPVFWNICAARLKDVGFPMVDDLWRFVTEDWTPGPS